MASEPGGYRVEFAPSASRDFAKLPHAATRRIAEKIAALAAEPRPAGVKKIVGGAGALRVRVGDYRVIYDVNDRARLILVRYVRHRSEAYR